MSFTLSKLPLRSGYHSAICSLKGDLLSENFNGSLYFYLSLFDCYCLPYDVALFFFFCGGDMSCLIVIHDVQPRLCFPRS